MDDKDKLPSLLPNNADFVAALAKSTLGVVPIAGSLLSELAGSIIPQQRIDRLARFAQLLEERILNVDEKILKARVADENFTDLVEESLRQATRAVSEERKAYLASVLANGIKSEDLDFKESKYILRILGEINDVEIIWLRFYLVRTQGGDEEFRNKHKEVLSPIQAYMASSSEEFEKAALQQSYKDHLVQLGLLEQELALDRDDKPEIDSFTRSFRKRGLEVTRLGSLLLRQIGFTEPD